MPKTSLIVATHARPDRLPRAARSAAESGSNVEVIIVDDGSTDATADVAQGLPGVTYIRMEKNRGVAAARNVGILASSAEYISFHDDDDVRFPGSIDRQVELLQRNLGAGLAYGPVVLGDQSCAPTDRTWPAECPQGDIFWQLLAGNFIPSLSVVYRKALFAEVGLLDAEIPGVDDWDIILRFAERYTVLAVPDPVGIWRVPTPSSGQGSSDKSAEVEACLRVQSRALRSKRAAAASRDRRDAARKSLLNVASDLLIFNAMESLRHGASRQARRNLVTAVRVNPRRAARPWTFQLWLQTLWRAPNS